MQLSNVPEKLVLPFAASGAKNNIPVASQVGITPGAASLTDGFPPLTRTPLSAGGVPPSGLDMNGVLFELSAVIRWANAGGGYAYDEAFATNANVNGYPKGARVMRSDGVGYWFNTVENNITDPEDLTAAADGWVPDFTNGVAAIAMESANVTLAPLEYGKPLLVISGTLTANLNLIFPNIAGQWTVINNTSGSFAVTCKTAAGTGVVILSGGVAIVCCDSVSVISASGDSTTSFFIQLGTGAVPRTVAAKLRESVSVIDFGAVANGVTNAATALVNALATGKTVEVPSGSYNFAPTLAQVPAIIAGLSNIVPAGSIAITLPAGTVNFTGTMANVSNPYADRIKVRGAAPLDKAISSIASISGSAGAWVVTATLADASGIAVGDVALVRDVVPGIGEPGSYVGRPAAGALQLGFFTMGRISTSGTSATLDGAAATTYMANGDLIIAGAEVRAISALAASAFTMSSALASPKTIPVEYWYHLRAAAGTVTVAGTAVTGSGTSFTTTANVGDLLPINGYGVFRITAIADNTHLTISQAVTVGSAAVFGIISSGELHEGAWEVTAVAGNNVTWTNKGRSSLSKPPIALVSGGNVRIIKTMLKVASGGGSGFIVQNGQLDINNVALIGDGNTASTGIDLRGVVDPAASAYAHGGFSGMAKLGERVGVINFGYGAKLSAGSKLYATEAMFSGNTVQGVSLTEGAAAEINRCTVSGNNGVGVLITGGAHARMSDTRAISNAGDGVRMVSAGASAWWDFGYAIANGNMGLRGDGSCLIHMVGVRHIKNISGGIQTDNGLYGRGSGMLVVHNQSTGLNLTHSVMEMGQTFVIGNVDGAIVQRSRAAFIDSGFANNTAKGLRIVKNSQVTCEQSGFVNNATQGIDAQETSIVFGANDGFVGNGTGVAAGGNALVYIPAYTGTITSAINRKQQDGGLITDGSLVSQVVAATFRQNFTLADDTAVNIDLGSVTKTVLLQIHSASSNTLQGAVRCRTKDSVLSAVVYGVGLTAAIGVLTGTTGTDGNFTVSPATDGKIYIENRTGGSLSITTAIVGDA